MPFLPLRATGRPSIGCCLLLVLHALCWTTPARAQGFFQQLFGLSSAPQATHVPRAAAPRQPLGGMPVRLNLDGMPIRLREAPRSAPAEGSGSYTTVCVRMCDGYYFPISHRASRGRFYHDAQACRSRCGEADAQLFYHPVGGDMKSAVDLTGRAYARLPSAFQHRKRLVAGCTCRPVPWSEASLIRHERYAMAEGLTVPGGGRSGGTVTIVAGNYPDVPTNWVEPAATPESAAREAAADASPRLTAVQDEPPQPDGSAEPASAERKLAADAVTTPQTHLARKATARGSAISRKSPAARFVGPGPRKPTKVAVASAGKLVWPGDPR